MSKTEKNTGDDQGEETGDLFQGGGKGKEAIEKVEEELRNGS